MAYSNKFIPSFLTTVSKTSKGFVS